MLKAQGWTDERIARVIEISVPTLTKHFRYELDHGADIEQRYLMRLLRAAAAKKSVPAIRELLARTEAARAAKALDELVDPVEERPPAAAKPARKGRKEELADAAHNAGDDPEWGDILRPGAPVH